MRKAPLALLLAAAAALACSEPRPPEAERAEAAAPVCTRVPEPDVAALQGRLVAGGFEELERELVGYQSALEESQACEPRAWTAFGAFLDAPGGTSRTDFAKRLDEWVAAQPASFVPRAARGTFYLAEGHRARGDGKVHFTKVSDEMWREMRRTHDLATEDLEKVRTLYPRYVFAHTSLMQIHRARRGGLPVVAEIAEEAMTLAPASYKVRRIAMESLGPTWGGSYETLDAIAEDALKHVGTEPRMRELPKHTFLQRAGDAYWRRDYRGALRWIEEALRYDRSATLLETRLGYIYFAGDYARVVSDAEEVLALEPRSRLAHRYRGLSYSRLGNRMAALRDLGTALEIDPADAYTRTARGAVLGNMGRLAEAEADLRLAVEQDPRDDYAWRELGRVLAAENRNLDEGIAALRRAVELDPDDPESWGVLGDALYVKGDGEGARGAFAQFVVFARAGDPKLLEVKRYLEGMWPETPPIWAPFRALQARR